MLHFVRGAWDRMRGACSWTTTWFARVGQRSLASASAEAEPPLRRDLKPGTLFKYLYADHESRFIGVVPPRHPEAPLTALDFISSEPGPGDLLTAVEVLWAPSDSK